jgi:hypothetical protein
VIAHRRIQALGGLLLIPMTEDRIRYCGVYTAAHGFGLPAMGNLLDRCKEPSKGIRMSDANATPPS